MAGPVRVRVRTAHPLPPAQFWVVIDRADDIDVVRERIARILQTRYDAPVTATALCLSVLDFEVWDLSLIHISEPTRPSHISRMPSSA